MKNKSNNRKKQKDEIYSLDDFDLAHPKIVRKKTAVVSRFKGKLRLIKTSVALPQAIIDDLRQLARIKGMTSYQNLLKEFVAERVFEEKKRLRLG